MHGHTEINFTRLGSLLKVGLRVERVARDPLDCLLACVGQHLLAQLLRSEVAVAALPLEIARAVRVSLRAHRIGRILPIISVGLSIGADMGLI